MDGIVTFDGAVISVQSGSDRSEWLLSDLDEVTVENHVVGGSLVAKAGDDHELLARFTARHAAPMGYLARLATHTRETERDPESDKPAPSMPPTDEKTCPTCGRAYDNPERPVCTYCLDKRSVFLRVLSFLKDRRSTVFTVLALMIVAAVLKLATPFLGGRILFDETLVPEGRFYGQVGLVVLAMLFFQAASIGVAIIYGRLNTMVAVEVVFSLKRRIFEAMQRLSMSFFSRKQTGGLLTRVNYDTTFLQYFFHDGVPYLVVNSVQILTIGIVMFLLDWRLTLLVLVPTPVMIYVTSRLFPRIRQLYSRQYRRQSILTGLVNDVFTGTRVVKAFGNEEQEISRFEPRNEGVYRAVVDTGTLQSVLFPSLFALMSVGTVLIWAVGGYWILRGSISFGTLMSFLGYLGLIYGPLQFMTAVVDWWSASMNSAQRIFEVLDAVPDVREREEPVRMPEIEGKIEFRNVRFAYEVNNPVIHGISLSINAGEMIGLVGRTGAGKSTITNLMTRLYDADEGEILIDNVPIKDLSISDLRSQIAIVLQETYLFAGSVAENIAYGRDDATREEIIRSARAAFAHDFITALPEGYDTVIGREGHDLSGGERQRIAIARAILRNPRILILDEATASMDSETEQNIQAALESLIEGRTVIAIAHRLSTLRQASRLFVIEHGRIAESGTHDELMEIDEGVYRGLVEKQRKALEVIGVGE